MCRRTSGGLHWVGAVPGGGRRPVRVGDLAAAGREREPADRCRGAGLGGARPSPASCWWPSSSRTTAGRTPAGWRWRAHGAGLYALGRWTPRFQYVAALAPLLSLAALALWWVDTRGVARRWDADRFAWLAILFGGLYAAGAFALLWNAARPGFWAALSVAAALAHFLLCWYVLRSVGDRHAVGPDQHRACRAVPGRRRAAGALARHA